MKLTALRLHGFKSFADRTEITFHDGITAVVGPNGCGKSNISDAIRWVLGEQRPTAIRGAKMEEAIFQGTVHRRPVNRGSVAMDIANSSGALPVPFEEVEIARTVYRDGGSEYQLNRSGCRLRDIQDLCRDTGLGANAYAVIENRMIDTILSDRADERRGLFEEAAGIGRYKDRRRAAVRRLERAETDLQRLEDLIGEVESKVRSLARQKGRAERYAGLKKRRLDVEIAVARTQLAELEGRLAEVREGLGGGASAKESLQAEIATAEARVESLRVERVEADRARSATAARLEELRVELVRWEREVAVSQERTTQARQRIESIAEERSAARDAVTRGKEESAALELRERERGTELEELRNALQTLEDESAAVRARLEEARREVEAVEEREREVARRSAQLEGEAESARAEAQEMERRIAHLEEELTSSRDALKELTSQCDLFTDQLAELDGEVSSAQKRIQERSEALQEARETLEVARVRELKAKDEAGALATRLATLERMERDREGMDPVLKALMADPPEGVLGLLADFLSAPPPVMAAVETFLGVVSRGVVVRDGDSAAQLLAWFRDEWEGGGGLIALPLDRVPRVTGDGSLLDRITPEGEGAPWVRALLHDVEFSESLGGGLSLEARDLVRSDGVSLTRQGLVRVGNPMGATGLLERRGELADLKEEAAGARESAQEAERAREEARGRLKKIEADLELARAALRKAEDAQREARSRETERSQDRSRLERQMTELKRQLQASAAAQVEALGRAKEATQTRESLLEGEEELRAGRVSARERLQVIQDEWEGIRSRVSERTVQEARLEGEVERLRERRQELTRMVASGQSRLEALAQEETRLNTVLEEAEALRGRGEAETRRLFGLRDEVEKRLREQDEVLAELSEGLERAETRVRTAQRSEREASEARHRLELEARELEGRIGRIQDRLEGEWGRSLDELMEAADPVEGTPEELQEDLREIVRKLDRLGPVNMLAVEEHEEESARLDFFREQRDDLVEARDDLRAAIREINRTATELFQGTFEAIRENFRATFRRLFQGGECDIWLEDPQDPLESDIEIQASPRGKRTQRIDLLSGGERALTALSLLFGIYLVKPSPFCVLDEVDAPLDESNIGRFIRLLQEFKDQTQFIVITHNPRTIEAADWIYGVTMEEPGVSSIVGVRLEEALEAAGAVL